MDRLAWVELLDRHGEVASRHPVHAWPLRVGRAYSNDIVLDDPHAAPHHVEIRAADEGRFEFKCGDTANGLRLKGHRGKTEAAVVSGDDVVRIGHTSLRVRPLDFPVADERLLPRNAWLQGWIGLCVATVFFLLVQLLHQWLGYTRAEPYAILVSPLLGFVPGFLLWAGFWSLIGRVVAGRARFIAHAVVAMLAFSFFDVLIRLLAPYLDFALDSAWVSSVSGFLAPIAGGVVLYAHLGLISKMSRRKLGLIVVGLTAVLIAYLYFDEAWSDDEHLGRMSYSRTLGPARMLLAQPQAADAFLAGADKLKAEADE